MCDRGWLVFCERLHAAQTHGMVGLLFCAQTEVSGTATRFSVVLVNNTDFPVLGRNVGGNYENLHLGWNK